MENKNDKNIEKLVDKMMAESTLESPSIDFTANIMSAVRNTSAKKALVYKPVISKRAWFIILSLVIVLFGFLIFNSQFVSASHYINFSTINFDKYFKPFEGFKISSVTGYVLLSATIMLFVQMFLLKNYLNKKLHK